MSKKRIDNSERILLRSDSSLGLLSIPIIPVFFRTYHILHVAYFSIILHPHRLFICSILSLVSSRLIPSPLVSFHFVSSFIPRSCVLRHASRVLRLASFVPLSIRSLSFILRLSFLPLASCVAVFHFILPPSLLLSHISSFVNLLTPDTHNPT